MKELLKFEKWIEGWNRFYKVFHQWQKKYGGKWLSQKRKLNKRDWDAWRNLLWSSIDRGLDSYLKIIKGTKFESIYPPPISYKALSLIAPYGSSGHLAILTSLSSYEWDYIESEKDLENISQFSMLPKSVSHLFLLDEPKLFQKGEKFFTELKYPLIIFAEEYHPALRHTDILFSDYIDENTLLYMLNKSFGCAGERIIRTLLKYTKNPFRLGRILDAYCRSGVLILPKKVWETHTFSTKEIVRQAIATDDNDYRTSLINSAEPEEILEILMKNLNKLFLNAKEISYFLSEIDLIYRRTQKRNIARYLIDLCLREVATPKNKNIWHLRKILK